MALVLEHTQSTICKSAVASLILDRGKFCILEAPPLAHHFGPLTVEESEVSNKGASRKQPTTVSQTCANPFEFTRQSAVLSLFREHHLHQFTLSRVPPSSDTAPAGTHCDCRLSSTSTAPSQLVSCRYLFYYICIFAPRPHQLLVRSSWRETLLIRASFATSK